jgi:sodium/hydrogen antiporter
VALHGNGFIAGFVGGLAFGAAAGRRGEPLVPFVEEIGALVSLLVWLAFGAVAIAPALEALTWQLVVYAVLSLTVIRMAPVALALAGAGLGRRAVAFIGWFGPRGLASVVFTLVALEEFDHSQAGNTIVEAATWTILLSVVLHGLSASPLAARYSALITKLGDVPEITAADEPRIRLRDLAGRRQLGPIRERGSGGR